MKNFIENRILYLLVIMSNITCNIPLDDNKVYTYTSRRWYVCMFYCRPHRNTKQAESWVTGVTQYREQHKQHGVGF